MGSYVFCILYYVLFFFFKQKTAYEMRISDLSSDVCSSDLSSRSAIVIAAVSALPLGLGWPSVTKMKRRFRMVASAAEAVNQVTASWAARSKFVPKVGAPAATKALRASMSATVACGFSILVVALFHSTTDRSEEHTSELQ